LAEEWRTEGANINDGVEILRAFDRAAWPNLARMTDVRKACRDALIAEATRGCRSDELRDLLSVLDLEDEADRQVLEALRKGFEKFRRQYFEDELRECCSAEQFDGLLEDLETFQRVLAVEVDREVERTQQAQVEFEVRQDAYTDHMQDEWKERWRQERVSEASVREMFGSLKFDRA
jgi:hypothetical protein